MFHYVEILIEFVNQRNRSWDVKLNDVYIKFIIPFSETLLNFLTIARRLLPWATTMTFFPSLTEGTMVYSQKGITRSIVVFKL
jgi:hypothetical protein